jgi:hypothetical protein
MYVLVISIHLFHYRGMFTRGFDHRFTWLRFPFLVIILCLTIFLKLLLLPSLPLLMLYLSPLIMRLKRGYLILRIFRLRHNIFGLFSALLLFFTKKHWRVPLRLRRRFFRFLLLVGCLSSLDALYFKLH